MKVVIDGIEYVPKLDIAKSDKSIVDCLVVLTEMRYFKQNHKMQGLAHNAINALAPYLAKLSDEQMFDAVRSLKSDND